MAALTNNGNLVAGDDISRTQFSDARNIGIYTNEVLPSAGDEGVTDFPFQNEDYLNLRSVSVPTTSLGDSGYLLYFSYLPSSYVTPDYLTFTLLTTPGVLIEEGGGSSVETWGVVGE